MLKYFFIKSICCDNLLGFTTLHRMDNIFSWQAQFEYKNSFAATTVIRIFFLATLFQIIVKISKYKTFSQ